jgi:hypothetical protein
MEGTKSISALDIDFSLNSLSHCIFLDFVVEVMQEALTHFLNIVDLVMAITE